MDDVMNVDDVIADALDEGVAEITGAAGADADADATTPPAAEPDHTAEDVAGAAGEDAGESDGDVAGEGDGGAGRQPFSFNEDIDLETVRDGSATVKFTSDGEEREVPIRKLVAHSQQLKSTLAREEALREERNGYAEKAQEAEKFKEAAEQSDTILRQILAGGPESDRLLKDMRTKYAEGLGKAPPEPAGDKPAGPSEDEMAAAARKLATEVISPHAKHLAELYEADPEEVAQEMVGMLAKEPNPSWDVVDDIMHRRLPNALEENGYEATGEMERFDLEPFREAGQRDAGGKANGLTPKGKRRKTGLTPREKQLEAENEALKAQLAEKALEDVPPSGDTTTNAGGKKKRGSKDAGLSNDLIDVSEAESVSDVMKALDEMEQAHR